MSEKLISTNKGQGGFCWFGDGLWIDQGHKETIVFPSKVSWVEFRMDEFLEKATLSVWMDGVEMPFLIEQRSESEARKIMAILAGDEKRE